MMYKLPEEQYSRIEEYLQPVNFNHLFARSVLQRSVSGTVYGDDLNHATTFYIVHKYGMSLLFGDHRNNTFNNSFRAYALNTNRQRKGHEWMQAYPEQWHPVLHDLFESTLIRSADNKENLSQSVIELNTRVNFAFDKKKFTNINKVTLPDPGITIKESTAEIFDLMHGVVVPRAFWDSAATFGARGVAFSLYDDGNLAATSFSSFLAPGKLELGIETLQPYRGFGYAQRVCAALIDYCLKEGLEPIWACRLENTGSFRLARKLGFEPSMELPYYRLSD